MSKEEMQTLVFIHESQFEINNFHKDLGINIVEIANQFKWSQDQANVVCQGLMQLGLVTDPIIDGEVIESNQVVRYHNCLPTTLAQNLLNWCGEKRS